MSFRLKRDDEAVVHRFAIVGGSGSVTALRSMFTADVFVVSDGGGRVVAALDPVRGADAVARCVTEVLAGAEATVVAVNGQAGVVLRRAGSVVAVVSLKVTGTKVAGVWIVLNPDKLRHWL